ncbi:MAG: hypothetical protein NT155_03275 [Candidatus Staskawiczbacteria bacterium]|nr:hypothetical protein [Candidatus Staskawiczbacteria bacterium]
MENNKKITIEELAKMIKAGFDGVDKKLEQVATKDQFDNLERRMIVVEGKLTSIDERLERVETVLTDAHVL